MEDTRKYFLEDRLIRFTYLCLEVCELLPFHRGGKNLAYQLFKSGIASALIYGAARAAESRADFIHKMSIVLKELRETRINLRNIIEKLLIIKEKTFNVLKESNELIAIVSASLTKAKN